MRYLKAFLSVAFLFFLLAGSAHAAVAAPGWTIDGFVSPTNFSEVAGATQCIQSDPLSSSESEKCDSYQVSVTDAGSEPSDGAPVVVEDKLPEGLSVIGIETYSKDGFGGELVTGYEVPVPCGVSGRVLRCTWSRAVQPDETLKVFVYVSPDEHAAGPFPDTATVSGGGAPAVSTEVTARLGSGAAPVGFSGFSFYKSGSDGAQETQAGGHPYELTTTIDMDTAIEVSTNNTTQVVQTANPKDIVVNLPLGFAGSTLAAPQCTLAQLASEQRCPPDTIVGRIETEPKGATAIDSYIYNLVPEHGYPAEFGYIDGVKGAHVFYVHVAPTPRGYVLQTEATDIPTINLRRIVVTFYGDPAEKQAEIAQHGQELELLVKAEAHQHELEKVLCEREEARLGHPVAPSSCNVEPESTHVERRRPAVPVPFFTNPTDCGGEEPTASVYMDSWEDPGEWRTPGHDPEITTGEVNSLSTPVLSGPEWASDTSKAPAVSGCNELLFTPEIGSQPTTHEADGPSGLEFEQRLAQTETFGVDATPALKDTTIVFPPGMSVDPSAADGLGTCSEAQIGWEGQTPAGPGELYDFSVAPPGGAGGCPESSKIGTLELETPLIPGKLYGEAFLAAQNANPFGSTFATYIVVNDPVTGVVLKLAGKISLCNATGEVIDGKSCEAPGQIFAVFDETPQLPFSNLKVHFFGGPRAEFATPPNCGTYTTKSELTPWSAPGSGLPATPFDAYTIDESCATGFDPSFASLTANVQAGEYTPFEGSFSREDDDQELQGLTMNLPPGLLANIPSVTECGSAEIAAEESESPGGCPAGSQVGTVTAEAGPGPNPLAVPGKVFWTGPYNGGPFGLVVVVSANPGPFHFGNVVVRQSLRINPQTAAATDVSDPFPTFIHPRGANGQINGIPIKLRRVNFDINRPGFTFNPADCNKLGVSGAITSTQGATSNLAVPFQVTDCERLKFEPKLTVSTSAKTSKANGASLFFKIAYPKTAAIGNQAWFKTMKFTIPKQLPARLTTIQKACLAKVFEANPAACPKESLIGSAVIHTPILPHLPAGTGSLAGPLYFVSYGNAKFPEAVLDLQGDGVQLIVHGETFISKTGVTSATFKTVPEAPFESAEVSVPAGPYSEFAANGSLCAETTTVTVKKKVKVKVHGRTKTVTRKVSEVKPAALQMPIEFTGSNGQEIKQSTPITVTGCPQPKGKTAKKVKNKAGKGKAGGKGHH